MNPERDAESGVETPSMHRRSSRAPWDPPRKPAKPGDRHRGAAAGGGKLDGADVFGGYDDDVGRGAD